jgi:hypothetical protein
MDDVICALCGRGILPTERAILLGIEKLLLHGVCYDEAVADVTGDVARRQRIGELARARPRMERGHAREWAGRQRGPR